MRYKYKLNFCEKMSGKCEGENCRRRLVSRGGKLPPREKAMLILSFCEKLTEKAVNFENK